VLTQSSIDAYVHELTCMGKSPETIRAYRKDLQLAMSCTRRPMPSWPELEQELGGWLNRMRTEWSPRTTRRRLSVLRGWGKFHGEPTFLARYSAPKIARAKPHPIPEGVDGVLRMIDAAADYIPAYAALVALTGLAGLRVSEAAAVRPEDIDATTHTLTVRGKGDKERIIPLSDTAWSSVAPALDRTEPGETLVEFCSGECRKIITRLGEKAGLSGRVSSHDMRATFATAAYSGSHNLRAVQELLGHASPETTQIYTMVSENDMRTAANIA
jgi:site-specific recombinase XerD